MYAIGWAWNLIHSLHNLRTSLEYVANEHGWRKEKTYMFLQGGEGSQWVNYVLRGFGIWMTSLGKGMKETWMEEMLNFFMTKFTWVDTVFVMSVQKLDTGTLPLSITTAHCFVHLGLIIESYTAYLQSAWCSCYMTLVHTARSSRPSVFALILELAQALKSDQ